ncbi:adenosylcobinamide-GDP ribazoletransferase [Dethiosulfatarculus sandiegensis]|uniref:Adenosylcobinamide-GDP ribazoletransferase n=1 Tax=Dethiosulfatarculus sandiegensis TaxID=1429043 RepID=A0A0D2IY32_9BACT|nr:adenosylcobinamide-GDP ribazoletransferase [Dethiosulfatarculus sandiegensis]KIX10939.1 cobalamin synthase [Dethiosulfatarculus sandiegensis]
MGDFLLALQFLTIITLRSKYAAMPGDFSRARSWFGLVGLIMGGFLALAGYLFQQLFPPLAVAALMIFIWAASSRFLHIDGLADSADALVHMTSRERALEIMKDSHLGSFGLSAVCGLFMIKFGALASLSPETAVTALLVAPPLARALAAALSVLMPPATPGKGLGAAHAQVQNLTPFFASTITALAAAGLLAGLKGLVAAFWVAVLGLILGLWFKRRLGGVTGDNLGAAIELSEAVVLLSFCALG